MSANDGHAARVMELTARRHPETTAPYDLVRKMRASVLVLGPLVARYGEAEVSLPGGCAIGTRPVDLHLQGPGQLGAEIELQRGLCHRPRAERLARRPHRLSQRIGWGDRESDDGGDAWPRGETELVNAAREPEIVDLAHCLRAMGAEIEGIGSDTLDIRGVERLHGAPHAVIPDRIEAGTYMPWRRRSPAARSS